MLLTSASFKVITANRIGNADLIAVFNTFNLDSLVGSCLMSIAEMAATFALYRSMNNAPVSSGATVKMLNSPIKFCNRVDACKVKRAVSRFNNVFAQHVSSVAA